MSTAKTQYANQATAISTEMDGLLDTNLATGPEHDNSVNGYIDIALDCLFSAQAATTGKVGVYALMGSVSGELSTSAKTSNMRKLGSVELNGTTQVRQQLLLERVPKFWKLGVINESGATLAASGNEIKLTGLNYTVV